MLNESKYLFLQYFTTPNNNEIINEKSKLQLSQIIISNLNFIY